MEGFLDRETCIHILERRFPLKQEEKKRLLYSDNIARAIQIVLQAHGRKLSDSWMNILTSGLSKCMSEIKDAVRVVCLSAVNDSMIMWSHYANNHAGYCIEYNFEKMDMFYEHLYPVVYIKDRYAVSKSDMIKENNQWLYQSICRKSDVWAYEHEWRIVTANYNKVMPQKLKYPDGKYVLNLKDNIKGFYLGAKISDDFKCEIIQFGRENKIAIYQMISSSKAYELETQKIV